MSSLSSKLLLNPLNFLFPHSLNSPFLTLLNLLQLAASATLIIAEMSETLTVEKKKSESEVSNEADGEMQIDTSSKVPPSKLRKEPAKKKTVPPKVAKAKVVVTVVDKDENQKQEEPVPAAAPPKNQESPNLPKMEVDSSPLQQSPTIDQPPTLKQRSRIEQVIDKLRDRRQQAMKQRDFITKTFSPNVNTVQLSHNSRTIKKGPSLPMVPT